MRHPTYLTFCFRLRHLRRGHLEIFISYFCSFDPCAKLRRSVLFSFHLRGICRLNDCTVNPRLHCQRVMNGVRVEPGCIDSVQSPILNAVCAASCSLSPSRLGLGLDDPAQESPFGSFFSSMSLASKKNCSLFCLPRNFWGTVGCTYGLLTLGGICL